MKGIYKKNAGFTLIELLVALVLLGFVGYIGCAIDATDSKTQQGAGFAKSIVAN